MRGTPTRLPYWPQAHAADRLAAVAQLVGLVVGVEGQRHGAARAVLPGLGPVAPAGAHLLDQLAPVLLGPLPGFQLCGAWVSGMTTSLSSGSGSSRYRPG